LGTSYDATARHLANLKLATQERVDEWLKVKPRAIKSELLGRFSPRSFFSDVWMIGLEDLGTELLVRPLDHLILKWRGPGTFVQEWKLTSWAKETAERNPKVLSVRLIAREFGAQSCLLELPETVIDGMYELRPSEIDPSHSACDFAATLNIRAPGLGIASDFFVEVA
jgi:hypothetical protein